MFNFIKLQLYIITGTYRKLSSRTGTLITLKQINNDLQRSALNETKAKVPLQFGFVPCSSEVTLARRRASDSRWSETRWPGFLRVIPAARCCHEVVFPVMPGASANGCFVLGVVGFGLFERVYSSVKAIGTETEIKGYKKQFILGGAGGEHESDVSDVSFVLLPRGQYTS